MTCTQTAWPLYLPDVFKGFKETCANSFGVLQQHLPDVLHVFLLNMFQLSVRLYHRREGCYQKTEPTISKCHTCQESFSRTSAVEDGQPQECKFD